MSILNIEDLKFEPLFTEEMIKERTIELGKRISQDYKDKDPIIVGVLNGCFLFIADLSRELSVQHEIDFIKILFIVIILFLLTRLNYLMAMGPVLRQSGVHQLNIFLLLHVPALQLRQEYFLHTHLLTARANQWFLENQLP